MAEWLPDSSGSMPVSIASQPAAGSDRTGRWWRRWRREPLVLQQVKAAGKAAGSGKGLWAKISGIDRTHLWFAVHPSHRYIAALEHHWSAGDSCTCALLHTHKCRQACCLSQGLSSPAACRLTIKPRTMRFSFSTRWLRGRPVSGEQGACPAACCRAIQAVGRKRQWGRDAVS